MWAEQQQRARERCWPAVEDLLGSLPPNLFRLSKLVEYDLALRHSESGRLRDIFLGPDQFPLLSIASWLLDDLDVPPGPARDEAEQGLFLVGLLKALRSQALAGLADAASFYDEGHVALVEFCSGRIRHELAGLMPPGAGFWKQYEIVALEELEWLAGAGQRDSGSLPPDGPETVLRGRWSAPARQLVAAV